MVAAFKELQPAKILNKMQGVDKQRTHNNRCSSASMKLAAAHMDQAMVRMLKDSARSGIGRALSYQPTPHMRPSLRFLA